MRVKTFLIEEIGKAKAIFEEDIVLEMVEHDFVTKMSPKKKHKIRIRIKKGRSDLELTSNLK